MSDELSRAQSLAALGPEDLDTFISSLSPDELIRLEWNLRWSWDWRARPKQMTPHGLWEVWLILAGRGFGKTTTGVQWIRSKIADGHDHCNIIVPTFGDIDKVLLNSEGGVLKGIPPEERPIWKADKACFVWPKGQVSFVFSADSPERLRGPEHAFLWCDELAAWRYPEAWDQAQMGLRLGLHPQACVTTTPRPTDLVKSLARSTTTHVTRGTTFENRANLAPIFLRRVTKLYEGTRLGRQELHAEILDDNPGAMWKRAQIDRDRISPAAMPALSYIAVGVDPATTSNDDSDDTGIVVVGRDLRDPPHFYVIDDRTIQGSPDEWASQVVMAFDSNVANIVIGETNQGGEMVEMVIRTKCSTIPYRGVHASRGKAIRAEPVSALYEQGRVHHVGSFSKMEDEMCQWDPITSKRSPNRMDALVWAFYGIGVGSDSWLSYILSANPEKPEPTTFEELNDPANELDDDELIEDPADFSSRW